MGIPIDREKKLELLKWLKTGVIDVATLKGWAEEPDTRTEEEINASIEHYEDILYMTGHKSERCRHHIDKGRCPLLNGEFDETAAEYVRRLPNLTAEEYANMIIQGNVDMEEVKSHYHKRKNARWICHNEIDRKEVRQ